MDPKMDSGFLKEGETLEDDFDVSKELLPEEMVGLMDQILCHEVRSLFEPRQRDIHSGISDADLGWLDGMAYGSPAFAVPLHFISHRPALMARTQKIGRRAL